MFSCPNLQDASLHIFENLVAFVINSISTFFYTTKLQTYPNLKNSMHFVNQMILSTFQTIFSEGIFHEAQVFK